MGSGSIVKENRQSMTKKMMRSLLTVILLLLVTACNGLVLLPTQELVQKAIALQVERTQQQISQQLTVEWKKFDIHGLSITQQQPLRIENLPAFRVQGTYDLTVQLPQRSFTIEHKPFEVLLQIQPEGKSWHLLIPEKTNQENGSLWRSYLVL